MKILKNSSFRKIGLFALGVLLTLVPIFIVLFSNGISAFAMENEISIFNGTIANENFAYDSVVVVLDAKISKINKIHNAKFFDGIEIESIKDLTQREKNMKSKNYDFRQILQIFLKEPSKDNVLNAIARLQKLDGVISAEPNYCLKPAVVPNDPSFSNGLLWGLDGENGIKAPATWEITRGSRDVRVGIIDSGIANHTDLDVNLATGRDTVNNNNITTDAGSHGTHVAGTIGAVGNNNTGGVGVNWDVRTGTE